MTAPFTQVKRPGASMPTTGTSVPASRSVVTTIPVGTSPSGIAFDSENGSLFVTDSGSNNVTVIDGATNKVTGSIGGVGQEPGAIAFDSSNGYLYATSVNSSYPASAVALINGSTNKAVGSIPIYYPSDPSLVGIAFDVKNGHVYVSTTSNAGPNAGTNNVTVINGATNSVSGSIYVGPGDAESASGVGVDTENGNVYVANSLGDNVTVIDAATDEVIGSVRTGDDVGGVGFDSANGCVYVNGFFTNVTVIDGSTNQDVAWLQTGANGAYSYTSPEDVAFDSENGYVYVTDSTHNNVTVIDGATNKVVAWIPVGSDPKDLAYDSANGDVYVVNYASDSVSVINGTFHYPTITSFAANPSTFVVGTGTSLNVDVAGGVGALTYNYTSLPTGCANSNVAILSCTPTKIGEYTTRVFVNDSMGNSVNTTTSFTVNSFPIDSFVAEPATVDVGITTQFIVTATGGSGTLGYSYTGLPQGCLTDSISILPCTPTAAGSYSIRVFVNDTGGNSVNATTTLLVNADPTVSLTATPNPTDANALVKFSVAASGGTEPIQYTTLLGNGTDVSGPTVFHMFNSPGNYTVRAYANDTFGLSATTTILITVYPQLAATLTASNTTPLLGQTVAFVANATGGLGPYNYSYTGFPPGCISENRPAIGCLPTQSDYYNITVQVTDHNGIAVNATASIHVIFDFNVIVPTNTSAGTPFTISVNTNETFSGGTAIVPSAGFGAFTYNYTGLPPGCTSEDSAVITCTPTQVGAYHITISVHDQVGDHQTHTVVVNVVPATTGPGILGLSGETGYLLLGGVAAIAAAVVAVLALRHKSGSRPPVTGKPVARRPTAKTPPTDKTPSSGGEPVKQADPKAGTVTVSQSDWEEMKSRLDKLERREP